MEREENPWDFKTVIDTRAIAYEKMQKYAAYVWHCCTIVPLSDREPLVPYPLIVRLDEAQRCTNILLAIFQNEYGIGGTAMRTDFNVGSTEGKIHITKLGTADYWVRRLNTAPRWPYEQDLSR